MAVQVRQSFTLAAVSSFPAIRANDREANFNMMVGITKTGGADVTYAVEGTIDGQASAASVWFVLASGGNVSGQAFNITTPAKCIRVRTLNFSGASTIGAFFLQDGV